MIEFTVPGLPQPKGSMKALTTRVVVSNNPALKPWTLSAQWLAKEAMMNRDRFWGAVAVDVVAVFERPKTLPKRITAKITKPDVDKLARAVLDAMTGIVFLDDAQVVTLLIQKTFGSPERTHVRVEERT